MLGFQTFDDLLAGQTFGQRRFVEDRFAVFERLDHLTHRGVFLDLILAGLQVAALLGTKKGLQQMSADEGPSVRDDPFLLEPFGNCDAAFAFRYDDRALRLQRSGAFVLMENREGRGAEYQHADQRDRQHAADDANEAA